MSSIVPVINFNSTCIPQLFEVSTNGKAVKHFSGSSRKENSMLVYGSTVFNHNAPGKLANVLYMNASVKGQPSQRLLISTHSTQGLPLQKTIDFYTPGVDWDTEDQSAPTLLLKISDGLVIDKFADVSMSPVCEIIVGPNSAAFSGKVYKPSYSANEFQIDIGNAIQLAGKILTQVAPVAYQIYLEQKGRSQNINDEPDGWGSVIGGALSVASNIASTLLD